MKKYITLLIIFAAIEISLALYLTMWREHFWNDVSTKNQVGFIYQLGVFTVVALGCCIVSGVSGYILNLTTIEWRKKLTERLDHSLDVENFSQRAQEDTSKYPELVLSLGYGFCKAIMYIIVFSISLCLSFEWWYLVVLLAYTIVGSIVTSFIAKPLIHLNYQQQRLEATYRQNLSRSNFIMCICLMLGIARKQKHLTYFQSLYMQVGVVVPLILIAPEYFSSAMVLGTLMRFNSLSSTILDNMGYGISSWGQINMLISCRKRLKEINII